MRIFRHRSTNDIMYENTLQPRGIKCYSDGIHIIPSEIIENSNDWYEMGEMYLDYEILELINTHQVFRKSHIKDKFTNGLDYSSIDELLNGSAQAKISKIKRLSDGFEFRLGDKLVLKKYMGGRLYITIDNIYFNEHNQLSFSVKERPAPNTFVFGMSDIDCTKFKKPLHILVTEDGVKIYEDTCYYSIRLSDFTLADNGKPQTNGLASGSLTFKTFSTKELAEQYIYENKPIYSRNDIKNKLKL